MTNRILTIALIVALEIPSSAMSQSTVFLPPIPVPKANGLPPTPGAPSLCRSEEITAFTCASSRAGDSAHSEAVSKKIISLCLTPRSPVDSGHLIYRFGADRKHIELEYPKHGQPAEQPFTADWDSWNTGEGSRVSFKIGDYLYTVYNSTTAIEDDPADNDGGIEIHKQGKLVSDRWCDGDEGTNDIRDHLWEFVEPLDLKKTTPETPPSNGEVQIPTLTFPTGK